MMETECLGTLGVTTSSFFFFYFLVIFFLLITRNIRRKTFHPPPDCVKEWHFWLVLAFLNDDNNLVESFCLYRGVKFRKGNCFWQLKLKLNETKREKKTFRQSMVKSLSLNPKELAKGNFQANPAA